MWVSFFIFKFQFAFYLPQMLPFLIILLLHLRPKLRFRVFIREPCKKLDGPELDGPEHLKKLPKTAQSNFKAFVFLGFFKGSNKGLKLPQGLSKDFQKGRNVKKALTG